jgi:activating signal cointegrator 1
MSEIRVITLWQPYASLIAIGLKKCETRSWGTKYRGKLAIHAAKRACCTADLRNWGLLPQRGELALSSQEQIEKALYPFLENGFPYGRILAIADLSDCILMSNHVRGNEMWQKLLHPDRSILIAEQAPIEREVGDWQPGRYAWKLDSVCPIAEPIPYKGSQGLSVIRDESILQQLQAVEEVTAQWI